MPRSESAEPDDRAGTREMIGMSGGAARAARALRWSLMAVMVAAAEAVAGGDLNGADRRWAVYYWARG